MANELIILLQPAVNPFPVKDDVTAKIGAVVFRLSKLVPGVFSRLVGENDVPEQLPASVP